MTFGFVDCRSGDPLPQGRPWQGDASDGGLLFGRDHLLCGLAAGDPFSLGPPEIGTPPLTLSSGLPPQPMPDRPAVKPPTASGNHLDPEDRDHRLAVSLKQAPGGVRDLDCNPGT